MGLLQNGAITVRRFLAMGPVPELDTIKEALIERAFRKFEDGLDTERYGFCDWRNPLLVADPNWLEVSGEAGDENAFEGILLGLRVDTRRIPGSTLKAHTSLAEKEWKDARGALFVPKEVRAEIKAEVEAKLIKEAQTVTKLIEIAWDLKGGVIYTTASGKIAGILIETFIKCFDLKMTPYEPAMLATKVMKHDDLLSLEALEVSWEDDAATNDSDDRKTFLGKEFLVWLWHQNMVEGGVSSIEDDPTCLLLGDALNLTASSGDVQDLTLKKGMVTESEAAFSALGRGLMPSKVKLRILDGDQEFACTYNGLTLDPSGLKIPSVPKGLNDLDRADARMSLLLEALKHLDNRFMRYVALRDEDAEAMAEKLSVWAKGSHVSNAVAVGDED